MSENVLTPLTGPSLRIEDQDELSTFLESPGAADVVRSASFEQVFFTLKTLGLGVSFELLPLVSENQVRGFVDLDCWRKDAFVRRPFTQWIAAFVQTGPEETVRAIRGIDPDVVSLFLKDLVEVFEIERDEPPPDLPLTFTPDGRLAVHLADEGGEASIASMMLDVLFKHDPGLGVSILRRVRYTTRAELEETAYQNRTRRLDVHGFVDYYEALSIYSEPDPGEIFSKPDGSAAIEVIPGELAPQSLPTVFAESLAGGTFLLTALNGVREADTERLADELTALGNRILSANLVNMGEVDGIRIALVEMRDFLTIGLEHLSDGATTAASAALAGNHIQAVFRTGFAQVARLRNSAQRLIRIDGFKPELLESPDVEFLSGLVRFKPLLWTGSEYRSFESLEEVRSAGQRIDDMIVVVAGLLELFGAVGPTLRQAFNTAVVRNVISGHFRPDPIGAQELEAFLADGVRLRQPELPAGLMATTGKWLDDLRAELEPLAGQKIDPRYVGCLHMRL